MEMWESLLMALGAVLTLCIFSYLIGDNPLYRLAMHIFVGASVAYVLVVTLKSVLWPILTPPDPMDSDTRLLWSISLIGMLLGGLLLMQGVRRPAWLRNLGRIPVIILLGVGVGVALGGAILGTLTPQLDAATNPVVPEPLKPLGQVVAVIGTVTGLMVFSFSRRGMEHRLIGRLSNRAARVGRWFLLIGFGAAYGGVLTASLAFFADRVQYLIEVVDKISSG